MITSGKDITRNKIFSLEDIFSVDTSDKLANIPEEILLKDAFASDAKFGAKCIKARFCGVGLPTTVENCHAVVINHGNFVAVQIDSGNTHVGDNLSISRTPVLVTVNSSNHLGFDLSHVW